MIKYIVKIFDKKEEEYDDIIRAFRAFRFELENLKVKGEEKQRIEDILKELKLDQVEYRLNQRGRYLRCLYNGKDGDKRCFEIIKIER